MPAHLGLPGDAPSDAEKSKALEAVAAQQRLTQEQIQALTAVGVTAAEHRQHSERPWRSDDDAMVQRLLRVRGWSPAAIAAFLHRPEAQVRAALRPQGRDRGGPTSAGPRGTAPDTPGL